MGGSGFEKLFVDVVCCCCCKLTERRKQTIAIVRACDKVQLIWTRLERVRLSIFWGLLPRVSRCDDRIGVVGEDARDEVVKSV
jgi:hypothetical protein